MKLELDINSVRNSSLDNSSDNLNSSDEVRKMLRSGISLAKEGNRAEARQTLLKVTEAESDNETAWLWLASISEYPEELLVFLQNVLKINPENERALEWAKQTKTLLSKTFVQRGINATRDNQKEFAKQCFLQGIVHDGENEMAWLWLASTSEAQEEKISHLQKVLQINPNNETALTSLNAVKTQMSQSLLRKANSAAISGNRENARQLLDSIMKNTPNLEEAWVLKAYLTDEYYEKIDCYQKALELNPENEAAQAGLASLQALAAKASKPAPAFPEIIVNEEVPAVEESLEIMTEVSNETPEEFLEETEDYFETTEDEQPLVELTDAPVVEQFSQPVEETNEQEVLMEEESAEEVLAETAQTETAVQETPVEEVQTVSFVTEESYVEEVEETVFEEVKESYVEEALAEEIVAEEVEAPLVQETVVEEAPLVQENTVEENLLQTEMEADEPVDSPTQELDEEFARTADVVFNSFEQPEDVVEEVTEVSQEFQTEPQTFENEVVEEKAIEQVRFEEPEAAQVSETESVFVNEVFETEQLQTIEEVSSTEYQSPYISNNGFEMIAEEPFANTIELSYSNLKPSTTEFEKAEESFEYQEESFEYQAEETYVQEFVSEPSQEMPVETFEYQESSTNGFVAEVPSQPEVMANNEIVEEDFEESVEEVVEEVQIVQPPQLAQCSFCEFENEVQTVVCHSCQAILSLSDLEMLLAHQGANQDLLLSSIEKMEVEKTLRDFSVEELTVLGIGHLNAKNLRKGFSYLQEASQLNPNDVVLSSKVNFLAIRLSEIEEQDSKAQENPVQSRTIMVVDDSPTVRKLISGKLEKCGHSVIPAIDGMDALAKINEVIPDLILLDITMPRLDGYQVCKLIRNNEITKDIPIVMISGKDGFFDKVRGRMAGSSGYITKPFGPDTLMKTIESYLSY